MNIYEIPLKQMPNFSFSTVINEENLLISLRYINDNTYMDLTVNNNIIFQGLRADANISLTSNYKYKSVMGDLIFICPQNDKVVYNNFNSEKCKMYYIKGD